MNLLDAFCCPYCERVLFKESYYFRCESDHRFISSFVAAGSEEAGAADASGAARSGATDEGRSGWRDGAPSAGVAGAPRLQRNGARLVLRVLRHSDRDEIGRVHDCGLDD